MPRPTLLIAVNTLILIAIFALLTQTLLVTRLLVTTQQLSGHVLVQRGGKGNFSALAAGDPVRSGDVVRADSDGTAEFQWLDGARWKIMPNTQITIKQAVSNRIKKTEDRKLYLFTGKVFIRIVKALGPAAQFEIETPTAVASVRGTIFSVEVKEGKTRVAVFKGQVKVTSGSTNDSGGGSAPEKAQQRIIGPGQAVESSAPGSLKKLTATEAGVDFSRQSSLMLPELKVDPIQVAEDGQRAIISGDTEAGDIVAVNGDPVRVLGNGHFIKRVTLKPGFNTFTITSTDKHGVQASLTRTVPEPANTPTNAPSGTTPSPVQP